MIMEPLCVVLHRNLKWRDSGERLLREMDSMPSLLVIDLERPDPQTERPQTERPQTERPQTERPQAERPR